MNATLQVNDVLGGLNNAVGETAGWFSTGRIPGMGRRKRRPTSGNRASASRDLFLRCSFEQLEQRHLLAFDVSLPATQFNVNEGVLLGFTAGVVDGQTATQPFTFSLAGGPAGATIDPVSGAFSWTPGETQGGGVFTFDVQVTDSGATPQTGSETVTVTVADVNSAPVLDFISNVTVNETLQARFTATATDADSPVNSLTFSLVGAPTGATINATTGVFTWNTNEGHGPGAYTFEVVVRDNGTPALTDRQFVTVTVNEVNRAPNLFMQAARSVNEGQTLTVTFTATDPDLPAQPLTFSLVGAPAAQRSTRRPACLAGRRPKHRGRHRTRLRCARLTAWGCLTRRILRSRWAK